MITVAVGLALVISTAQALEAQTRGRGVSRDTPTRVVPGRSLPRAYEEPAYARGYAAGREQGLKDARSRERYDPVASAEYRGGDRGYESSYGSRDAYKSNYRAGFRQGYEDGYRRQKPS